MVDVSRWLAEQGLGHHAEAFAQNGIAGDILHELTDADLKELGLNLGDRKRLLKAIAALPAAGLTRDKAEAAERTAPPVDPRDAERRQLTVLFCDLVGSTELSAAARSRGHGRGHPRLPAPAAPDVIERWDGHVAKYMGDGVLAYFGWPQAHEDDAERAVRAGLELADDVGKLDTPAGNTLAARIGIATGLVMVGELIGEGAAQEQTVVGETPNLAARLQALAAPGACRHQPGDSPAGRWAVRARRSRSRGVSRASPHRWPSGGSKARVAPKAASRRCTASISRRWSDASTNSVS